MSSDVTLRLAQCPDIPTLARIANAANAQSALHKRIALHQDRHPIAYYNWRLNVIRQRFATPDVRTIVAEDVISGEILGFASWAVEDEDTELYKRWVSEARGPIGWRDR
jgi:hypothetical protein